MRICAGALKGRRLVYPKTGIRPTKDITRQAIFNVLGIAVRGARVCDLFAGGGALGIEALSRGAVAAVFVEKSILVIRCLKENLAGLKNVRIIKGDVFRVVPKLAGASFDIVFADPPYHQGLASRTVAAVARYQLVKPEGWLVVEHSRTDRLPVPEHWQSVKTRVYGESMVSFYRRQK
ncbi:MAG: 16S rRNA (guanine(966)-N(2))-methyltransferase RsmD [candidate division WOR-3 bacterium]